MYVYLRATELGRTRAQVITEAKGRATDSLQTRSHKTMVCGSSHGGAREQEVGPPQVPTLRAGERLAEDHSSKVAMLREKFFPITSADLSDIESQVNQAPFIIEQSTTIEEITATLASCSASSAPGDDEIPFSFLKALGEPVTQALTHLTNASLRLEHLPPFLKRARTIVIKKPGKDSYETPSA